MAGQVQRREPRAHRLAFALGLVGGMLLKGIAQRMVDAWAAAGPGIGSSSGNVTYDNNLPDQLERREPAPRPGQPRFGGTGAIGVPSAAVNSSMERVADGE